MRSSETLALSGAEWTANCVEGSSTSDLVLQYYDRERIPLERFLHFLGVDAENGRDIVQDAFVKLHEHLLHGGDTSNLRAWLYRVVRNLAQNRRSAAAVSKTAALAGIADPAARWGSPEQAFLDQERDTGLRAAVDALSSAQRDCIVLRAQGFRYREIAEILQLSTSTVGETVQRAIEQLRKVL